MTEQQISVSEPRAALTNVAVFRNTRRLLFWSVLLMGGAFLAGAHQLFLGIAGCVAGAYALHGLIIEMLGVKVADGKISAPCPIRSFPGPFVIGRMTRSLDSLEEIRSIPKNFSGERVRLKWYTGERLALTFSERSEKLRFFELARRSQPRVYVYRRS